MRRATWGRWMALGVAFPFVFPHVVPSATTLPRTPEEWVFAGVSVGVGVAIIACLAGRGMADRYEGDHFRGSGGTGRSSVSGLLPWVLALNLSGTMTAAAEISLAVEDAGGAVIAWKVATLAAFAAAFAGVILLGRRTTAGLLLLTTADLALVALFFAAVPDPFGPSAVSIALATGSAVAVTAALGRPMARILRGLPPR